MSDLPPNDEQNDGIIDERERPFLKEEKVIAQYLVQHGARLIKARKEQGKGRQPDAEVDGVVTEFKLLKPGYGRKTVTNKVNESLRKQGQARYIIVDARGSGLTVAEAQYSLARVAGITRGKLDTLRILGDGFDVSRVYG